MHAGRKCTLSRRPRRAGGRPLGRHKLTRRLSRRPVAIQYERRYLKDDILEREFEIVHNKEFYYKMIDGKEARKAYIYIPCYCKDEYQFF